MDQVAGRSLCEKIRKTVNIKGIVQGVGFRPFVFSLAKDLNITGSVCNNTMGVKIDIEGDEQDIEEFLHKLKTNSPPLSKIDSIMNEARTPAGYEEFVISDSDLKGGGFVPIPADTATCPQCLKEMSDPLDRRYMYSFINCTQCGPRFTIIEDIPYDRPNTSMKSFTMCSKCIGEYKAPSNRRFHAQPVACPNCGPKVHFIEAGKPYEAKKALQRAVELLKAGKILALKGIGGYHLAVDARDEEAVLRLRTRKNRYSKPLAVMMGSMELVEKCCIVGQGEKTLLSCTAAPIVLLKLRNDHSELAKSIAPGLNTVGVMLPYSPLHHLIMDRTGFPIVMTSGNISDEPLEKDDEAVQIRLRDIADGFLTHDRAIVNRIDDSVCFFGAGRMRTVRRGRGYAPTPFLLRKKPVPLLACGVHNKNTFCLLKDEYAFLSHHIGDLGNALTFEYYRGEIEKYKKMFRVEPVGIAKDLHPGYLSSRYADEFKLPVVAIQHHHAHIVSVMVEYGVEDMVLGIAYDSTGLGSDGNIWGAEFLLASLKGFQRVGQLRYVPLPGGDVAVKQPYRAALGFIYSNKDGFNEYLDRIGNDQSDMIFSQIDRKINTPLVSSMGRLFDAVASMVNLRDYVEFEGQAAMELESIVQESDDYYEFDIIQKGSSFAIDVMKLLKGIYSDNIRGVHPGVISAKFHNTIIKFTTELSIKLRDIYRINKVVLSGGCFQNKYLLEGLNRGLLHNGFEILIPSIVPINDEGVSLGQAAIAQNYLTCVYSNLL